MPQFRIELHWGAHTLRFQDLADTLADVPERLRKRLATIGELAPALAPEPVVAASVLAPVPAPEPTPDPPKPSRFARRG